jgi:SNF2 family DNA or RNA helicase
MNYNSNSTDNPAITIRGKELVVRAPKHPATEIKSVLGGRFNKQSETWKVIPTSMNVLKLVDWYGPDILKGAPQVVQNLAQSEWGFTGWNGTTDGDRFMLHERALNHPWWDELYDFQQEAVEYMVCNPHRGTLLGLEPGLGKAPTAIVAMDILELTKVLIVAPLTLARNWQRELDKWSQLYRSWSRATRSEKDPKTECVITNHEVLFDAHFIDEDGRDVIIPGGPVAQKKWIEKGPTEIDKRTGKKVPKRKRIVKVRESYDMDWDLIIIDESILLKNRRAVKIDVLMSLVKYAGQVWLLSGSPTSKFRNDLYPQVKMIMPRGFRSYWRFTEFFCMVDRGQWGWKVTGDNPEHDPESYLRDFLFMKSQKDVLPELPDYIYDPIEIELNADQAKAFRTMVDLWYAELESGKRVDATIILAQMTRMAQITSNLVNLEHNGHSSSAKEDLLMSLTEEEEIKYPLLVWCWWVPTAWSVANRIHRETKLAVDVVVGDMKGKDKDGILDAYKAGKLDVLVLQMGVGKFGHTLTDTRTVFYHDRFFDSDAYFQSLRRVRRIGLDHKPRLIVPRAPFSADPMIELNLSGKLQSIAKLGNKDLRELLMSLGGSMIPWSMEREQ